MTTRSARARRQRFSRSTSVRVRLTPDDVAIIRHIARHRFLRSTHIVQLFPKRPAKKLIERLGLLYHAGFLDRPRAQIDYYLRHGSARMVYGLGSLAHVALPELGLIDWQKKNRTASQGFIKHELMLADIMVAIEVAAQSRRDLEYVPAEELRPTPGEHWRLATTITIRGNSTELAIIPDAVFALRFNPSGRMAYFFVEADRRNMPVHRSDLNQSSFRKKALVYHHAAMQRTIVDRFGFTNFRVLTVTSTPARIASMQREVKSITRSPSGRFLFASRDLFAVRDPLSFEWSTLPGPSRLDTPPRA
ncbi:MAG TPA: replication-relaxation family protein [Dehalococcoidia bacterium]|nr:replication-relaxation family protein [Dehalococcoidia bacterium]